MKAHSNHSEKDALSASLIDQGCGYNWRVNSLLHNKKENSTNYKIFDSNTNILGKSVIFDVKRNEDQQILESQ